MNETINSPQRERVIRIKSAGYKRTYGVVLLFDQKTKIHFETDIRLLSQTKDNVHLFEIDRKQVYVNGTAPDFIIDKLADDLGKVLYPMTVSVNDEGFLKSIENRTAIQKRWIELKESITQYYTGEIAIAAIKKLEATINSDILLFRSLQNDWFLSLFFSGIYSLKSFDFRSPTLIRLPLIAYKPLVDYWITREITQQHTENKSLTITCKGSIKAAPASHENSSNLLLNYDLYHKDFSISSITGRVSLNTDENNKHIDIEIFHLKERDEQ